MRRDRRKDLYRTERDSLEGPQEEAEIQRMALRRGKNLAFSEDTCLEKERVRSKVTDSKLALDYDSGNYLWDILIYHLLIYLKYITYTSPTVTAKNKMEN